MPRGKAGGVNMLFCREVLKSREKLHLCFQREGERGGETYRLRDGEMGWGRERWEGKVEGGETERQRGRSRFIHPSIYPRRGEGEGCLGRVSEGEARSSHRG